MAPPGSEAGRGGGGGVVPQGTALGYTADEKLRLEQLKVLRRRWLKDQELSPREPVLPPRKPGLVEGFWEGFLKPGGLWRQQVFKTYKASKFLVVRLLIPFWLAHYYTKYHLACRPYGIVETKPKIYPGDTIMETGEVVPPLAIPSSHH
ncbi:NADH dehydrogenase [ubiquinone] 1 beta subcomplex subunit 6 [Lacerta agilis]|uniref:NADH dehydrogenase [ubiquinone] 1 beta subcomplex subunit 6 n=1 Tax=Lacerta agilis TaxID=80427 RepID=UPI001419F4EB|nr:NADH dehydrogenase [ubiquinone] 1 beta subcomplex subunit 6 [Lacerta agilis]